MTPTDAAQFVARHSAPLGESIRRTADAILRDDETFRGHYRRAAHRVDRRAFATLVQCYAALAAYHADRAEPEEHSEPDPQ